MAIFFCSTRLNQLLRLITHFQSTSSSREPNQNQDQPNENQLQNVSPPLPNHDPEAVNSSANKISVFLYYRIEPDLPELVIY